MSGVLTDDLAEDAGDGERGSARAVEAKSTDEWRQRRIRQSRRSQSRRQTTEHKVMKVGHFSLERRMIPAREGAGDREPRRCSVFGPLAPEGHAATSVCRRL